MNAQTSRSVRSPNAPCVYACVGGGASPDCDRSGSNIPDDGEEGREDKTDPRDERPTEQEAEYTHKGHAPNGAAKHQESPPVEEGENGPQRRETAENDGVWASAEEKGALKTVQSCPGTPPARHTRPRA